MWMQERGPERDQMRRLAICAVVAIVALGATESAQAVGNEITSPDTAGFVGEFTSLALDADGYPVVAYRALRLDPSGWMGDLRILHCNDPACAGGDDSITTPDAGGDVTHVSVQLDAAGFPVVAYRDQQVAVLKLLHCNDRDCAGGDESITVADANGDSGYDVALDLDGDGFPVIAHHESPLNNFRLVRCNDADCAGNDETSTVVEAGGGGIGQVTGRAPDLIIDADGLPAIAYLSGQNAILMRCNDASCAGGDELTASFPARGDVSLALDAGGNPVLAFTRIGSPTAELRIAHCDDAACQGGGESETTPLAGTGIGPYLQTSFQTSLRLNASGHPVVAFTSVGAPDLTILVCNDVDCAGGGDESVATVDVAGFVGLYPSAVIGTDGHPVVSYYDGSRSDLKVIRCGSPDCAPGDSDEDGLQDPGDNCPFAWNPDQANNDSNRFVLAPTYSTDDWTRANSDALGDACDEDDDNDGVPDAAEPAGCNGGGPIDPSKEDSDGDLFVDGAECTLGTDPADPASKPGENPSQAAACGPATDSDGDTLSDRLEVCGYPSDPDSADTDGDLDANWTGGGTPVRDGCEATSFDRDRAVNSGDQLRLAYEMGRVLAGGTPYTTIDVTKDGKLNAGDQLALAKVMLFGGC